MHNDKCSFSYFPMAFSLSPVFLFFSLFKFYPSLHSQYKRQATKNSHVAHSVNVFTHRKGTSFAFEWSEMQRNYFWYFVCCGYHNTLSQRLCQRWGMHIAHIACEVHRYVVKWSEWERYKLNSNFIFIHVQWLITGSSKAKKLISWTNCWTFYQFTIYMDDKKYR